LVNSLLFYYFMILYVSWALSFIIFFIVFTDTYRIYSVHIQRKPHMTHLVEIYPYIRHTFCPFYVRDSIPESGHEIMAKCYERERYIYYLRLFILTLMAAFGQTLLWLWQTGRGKAATRQRGGQSLWLISNGSNTEPLESKMVIGHRVAASPLCRVL